MSRMPMPRDRAAPMEWERENSSGFVNVLDSEESTGFNVKGPHGASRLNSPSPAFGQHGAATSNVIQSKRPFTEVWGSATPRPLNHDALQGTLGPDPPQPPALGGPLFFGTSKRASTFSGRSIDNLDSSSEQRPASLERSNTIQQANSFSFSKGQQSCFSFFPSSSKDRAQADHSNDENFDADASAPTALGRALSTSGRGAAMNRSSAMADEIMKGTHELSIGGRGRPLATGAIKRVLRNRNARGEPEFSIVHADDPVGYQHLSDSDGEGTHHSTRREGNSRSAASSRIAPLTPNRRNMVTRTGSRQHGPKPTLQQARSWQENVDLPFILSGYAQLLLNMVLVSCLFMIGYNAYSAVQRDIQIEVDKERRLGQLKFEEYIRQYKVAYACEPTPLEGNIADCRRLKQLLDEFDSSINTAAVSAHTYAKIANAFVNTLTFKTMFFLLLLILGGLFVSNYALNSYRSNYVLHHQHHIAANTMPIGAGPRSNSKDRANFKRPPSFVRSLTGTGGSEKKHNTKPSMSAGDRSSRKLLLARSGSDSVEDDGSSSESDVDKTLPNRRFLALPNP